MEIIAEKRTTFGKKLDGEKLAAVMYGKHLESLPIYINEKQFSKVFKSAGETSLIELNIDNKTHKVLVKDTQINPVTDALLHVSFYKVNLLEKITAEIPVEIIGEENNALVKSKEALVLQLLNEIEVEALPTDLPSAFVVDVSKIEKVGDGFAISQLDFDREKVKILGYDPDELIAKLDYAEMEEEIVEAPTEEELINKVEATKELTEEEKAAKVEKDKEKKEQDKK